MNTEELLRFTQDPLFYKFTSTHRGEKKEMSLRMGLLVMEKLSHYQSHIPLLEGFKQGGGPDSQENSEDSL